MLFPPRPGLARAGGHRRRAHRAARRQDRPAPGTAGEVLRGEARVLMILWVTVLGGARHRLRRAPGRRRRLARRLPPPAAGRLRLEPPGLILPGPLADGPGAVVKAGTGGCCPENGEAAGAGSDLLEPRPLGWCRHQGEMVASSGAVLALVRPVAGGRSVAVVEGGPGGHPRRRQRPQGGNGPAHCPRPPYCRVPHGVISSGWGVSQEESSWPHV